MEDLFENKTKYSQNEYNTFLKFHKEEYAVKDTIYSLSAIIFFLICIILTFKANEKILCIILLMGLVMYIWYKLVRPYKNVEKEKKEIKSKKDFINTYKFCKNYFKVESPEGNVKILYFKVYRVIETNTNFYIYISRENAFLISKKTFTKGNSKDFSDFIKKKMFFKYKNRIKRSSAL